VQNLIQNALNEPHGSFVASTKDGDQVNVESSKQKVDTSSERIKALTGKNWAAAFSSTIEEVTPSTTLSMSASDSSSSKRPALTPEERARQNRERNRQHARNTRLRKKAYVDELTRTLKELVAQRDNAEAEKEKEALRELEIREVRFRVLEDFLNLRGRNETNQARWSTILDDSFTMKIPLTNYRQMIQKHPSSSSQVEQQLDGVNEVMADSSFFSDYLQSLARTSPDIPVTFRYTVDRENFMMDGCLAVLDWTGSSVGAVSTDKSQCLRLFPGMYHLMNVLSLLPPISEFP